MVDSTSFPPGPRGVVEVVRAFRRFTKNPPAEALAVQRRYGDLAGYYLVSEPLVFIGDPGLVGEVLLDKDNVWIKDRITRSLSVLIGNGLLTSDGEFWKKQRKLIAPPLTKKHIANYADAMVRATKKYTAGLGEGTVRNIHADMSSITLEIVVETLFGAEIQGGHERVGHAVERVMLDFHEIVQSFRRFFPEWVPFAARRRTRVAMKTIDEVVFDVIKRRRDGGERGDDLLSRLLEGQGDDGSRMTDSELRDEAMTLFVAGHETTAGALSFALMLLGDHPEIDARMHQEIEQVLGGRAATAADVPSLRVVDAVIKETLRLYPPAHLIGREATRDVLLGGFRLPKGTGVLISPWSLHHDDRFWSDPLAFRPDRWLDGSALEVPKNAYLPFGGGQRVCIGNHYAMMEAVLVLATLAQRVRFERASADPVRTLAAITLRPLGGLPMRVASRTKERRPTLDPIQARAVD